MKNHLLYSCLFFSFVFLGCQQKAKQNSALEKSDVQRIALIGGSLISDMENYGFFERALLQNFPQNSVSLRNIAWPADDVFGLARSQFGSAQNTRSWQPPTAEEGFGSKVLMEHIDEVAPKTMMIGYGSEAAYFKNETDFDLFSSGYKRLMDFAESKGIKLILLSPPKQEAVFIKNNNLHNEWLGKAANFINKEATNRGHLFIDLYMELITDPSQKLYTENGIQLNRAGYKKMNEIILEKLGLSANQFFKLKLDEQAGILHEENCQTSDWTQTVNGVSFYLTPDKMLSAGQFISTEPIAVYVNGRLSSKNQDTISLVYLYQDSLEEARLMATIKEKNRLYRYRIRPLNEAYIYLFRRHEMGHLAYEMDDLNRLVVEKEREINRLLSSQRYDIEVELIKPWSPPKDYPEDEVPAFIPVPDIEAEIAAFDLPAGYEINLFAADPMIANPININWDTKGRAWVATSSTYPHIVPGREPNDKVVILEDTNQDGKADKHTVFAENMLVPHSVMPVNDGAYVTATTELLYFEDTDGDNVADTRRVVYDGFGNADVHHMIHGLRWTPWGDLHFTQSIYINSFVETPYGSQVLNGSGIWSFRPETEKLTIFSRGLINPWGEAFDQWGQAFATDGAGSSGMNYVFPESAHATAVGAPKVLPGLNSGTPKNTAAEVIYSRHFPNSWQGTIITNDFRANRTVRYKVSPNKSGYHSEEVELVLKSKHRSYRPVDAKIGPDGALYIVDWYNPIIDHGEVDFHHPIRDKTHGRIWRLTKKGSPLVTPPNLQKDNPADLLNLLKAPEQFTRLQANRAFVEQKGDPQLVINWIKKLPKNAAAAQHRLEGLWLLAALNHYEEGLLTASLKATNPNERAAAVRLLGHWKQQKQQLPIVERLINDPSPQVRLETIHALREMGDMQAINLVMQVLNHPMDRNLEFALDVTLRNLKDVWLPALTNKQNIFNGDINKQLYALLSTEDTRVIPPINQLLNNPNLDENLSDKAWLLMAKIGDAGTLNNVLQKAAQTSNTSLLRAMANAPVANQAIPTNLDLLEPLLSSDQASIRQEALKLAGRWKASQYASLVSKQISNTKDLKEKVAACKALVDMDQLETVKKMAQLDKEAENRATALSIWIEEAPAAAAKTTVDFLANLTDPDLSEILFLSYRKLEKGPEILRQALAGKSIPENIATAGLKVVQSSGLNLKDLDEAIRTAGSIQPVGMELSEKEKTQLVKEAVATGNRYRGRQIYRRPELLCGSCHRTQREGGYAGPDLSTVGSYMTPNSILASILTPNADIKQNYETVLITKKNGEIISGLLHRKTNNATLIRQANSEIVEIPAAEIAETDVSPVSLMPTGLTRNLSRDELTDLLAYLVSLGTVN